MKSEAFEAALNGLGTFREANLAVVPMAPTKAMIETGSSAGGISPEAAMIIYESMINAHFLNPIAD